MRVWVLQIGEPLPIGAVHEMRTAHLCRTLASRGHTVLWWASAFDHFSKEWLFRSDARVAVAPSLEILALRGCGYRSNVSLRRFVDHRLVAWRFRRLAPREPRPDLIVASLPSHDLAFQAARYAARHAVPLVIDVRDPWPDWLVDHLPGPLRGIGRVALEPDYAMVRYQLRQATALTSMMDSLLHWAQERGGPGRSTAWDRVFYLGAHRLAPSPALTSPKLAFLDDLQGRTVFSFVGTFGRHYHPAIVADAARRMQEDAVHFVLAGTGDFLDEVRRRAAGLSNVTLPGWLDEEEIACLMSRSAAGIVPANTTSEALPNKVFTYFGGGRPIISSVQGELPALLEHERVGVPFAVGDVEGLVRAVRRLAADPAALAEMTRNAQRFFDRALDASVIYESFADHLEAVGAGGIAEQAPRWVSP